ncbi:hypothetical protein [Hymenobacter cellulosivorans]|uniref:Multidrug transporter n=1 Tax=Hymenobacter cellulosivorans TaxID=2932249 RepID=A0ABY4F799_9BACT|nr:hypothetical protein [Hymenobacter cellulosivorans]UOQ51794.1 hypothetical protein MUN80_18775 [Hymenobacter cellulosivorans]
MSKRELIEPTPGDKRYVRRNEKGQFTSEVDLNRSLSQDDKHNSSRTSRPGQGDRGDGHTGNRKPGKK